jgi:hypothetical protein
MPPHASRASSISGVAVGITRFGFSEAPFGTESSTWARPGFSHSGSGESSFRLPSALRFHIAAVEGSPDADRKVGLNAPPPTNA